MELNESLVKVDQTLDSTTKKIEKLAKEMLARDLKIEAFSQSIDVLDYIKNFKWDDNKYHRGRSLVEIAGLITERMKTIDSDIKKLQDEYTEARNNYNSVAKKEGTNFLTKDLNEVIYTANLNTDALFVEKHSSEFLTTVIAIVHKTKVTQFQQQYEELVADAAVPRCAQYLQLEDKDGYQLWRIVVLSSKIDEYMAEGRRQGLTLKKFTYNYEKYKADQEEKTKLEQRCEYLKVSK